MHVPPYLLITQAGSQTPHQTLHVFARLQFHQLKGERSYHIFYQLVKGAPKDSTLKQRLLQQYLKQHTTRKGGCQLDTAFKDQGVKGAPVDTTPEEEEEQIELDAATTAINEWLKTDMTLNKWLKLPNQASEFDYLRKSGCWVGQQLGWQWQPVFVVVVLKQQHGVVLLPTQHAGGAAALYRLSRHCVDSPEQPLVLRSQQLSTGSHHAEFMQCKLHWRASSATDAPAGTAFV